MQVTKRFYTILTIASYLPSVRSEAEFAKPLFSMEPHSVHQVKKIFGDLNGFRNLAIDVYVDAIQLSVFMKIKSEFELFKIGERVDLRQNLSERCGTICGFENDFLKNLDRSIEPLGQNQCCK